jgi:hypothetical protein
LEDKRIPYKQLLNTIKPKHIPKTRKCASCGQTMHPVKVNPYIVFFVHSPDQFEACAKVNPGESGQPLIWCNKHMIRNQLDEYYKKVVGVPAR